MLVIHVDQGQPGRFKVPGSSAFKTKLRFCDECQGVAKRKRVYAGRGARTKDGHPSVRLLCQEVLRFIRKVNIALGIAYFLGSIAVSLGSWVFIGYCVVNARWLPAIFTLLARREVATWMERESRRQLVLAKSEVS